MVKSSIPSKKLKSSSSSGVRNTTPSDRTRLSLGERLGKCMQVEHRGGDYSSRDRSGRTGLIAAGTAVIYSGSR
jgi:hypothetical protein